MIDTPVSRECFIVGRKKYIRPTISVVKIDRSISLILMSTQLGNGHGQGGGYGPGGKPKGAAQASSPFSDTQLDSNQFNDNPFGG